MSTTGTIIYKKHTIHYHKMGHGSKVMLAFHGFGQVGADLQPLSEVLAATYTTYSIDLFYHGKSYWEESEEAMTKTFWQEFISEFIKTHQISTFSLCGFSLGGKFALSTLEAHPDKVEKVLLLAPDGIKTSMWYSLATYPGAFKNYFRSMIVKPHRFFNLLKLMKKLGFVEKGISKFAASQMNSTKKRRRVYYAWMVFKELNFDLKAMGRLINQHHIELQMYLGTHDKIITEKGMTKLLQHVKNYELNIIESGHNRLIEKTAEYLKSEDRSPRRKNRL